MIGNRKWKAGIFMDKYFDINEQGFSVRCKYYYDKNPHTAERIVIATYGFGGNKDNKAVEKFADRLISKYHGYGVICFDWPCHGKDARNRLDAEECITYLDLAVRYAREVMHAEHVYNYSSSFGAYITLRYLEEKGEDPFEKTAFRCPALRIYDSLTAHLSEDDWGKMKKGKEITMGYDRKMKIGADFFEDLRTHDVSSGDFISYADSILMIHGTKDEMVPIAVTREFSENNVIDLIEVDGADHPFSNPKHMDLAIQKIISFFAPQE